MDLRTIRCGTDLVRLPEMGAAELQFATPADEACLNRLLGMHQAMMSGAHE